MIIGNYQTFFNLVKSDNVENFRPLIDCVNTLSKICSCQKDRRSKKSTECNTLYINIVKHIVPSMVEYFKTKTPDSDIGFNHDTHHQILTLKLK